MGLHFDLLTGKDMKQINDLKESYGGAQDIMKSIKNMRKYEVRKKTAEQKGYGEMLEMAEDYAKSIAKVEDFVEKENIRTTKEAVVTTQVSGWQGAPVALGCLKRVAGDGTTLAPKEMISVMALTEDYVYNGELISTLAMTENLIGSKFCNTNLIGTPLSNECYVRLEKVTGEKFETIEPSPGMRALVLKNQGTFFGNFGGIEVANNNHLVYLDGITRAAVNTGTNFFLNPSWSTIIAGSYYARDIKNMEFKISMLLSTQNAIQFRMLLNIMKEFICDDGTPAISEINLGNGMSPEMFIQCAKELQSSGLPDVLLTAHIRINSDLGIENFNWTENAYKVLDAGINMTIKYESDGTSRPLDTMETYFLPKEERLAQADKIGEVLYYKCVRCSEDAKEMMRNGHKALFARISYRNH
ncbi:MAG: hypothetical protein COT45_01280 [bacterium (Candidatus Stahlbacteria) CG08_land_8_20_14_0_20_40_26]|nr:MAG: hypothetical protein COT45_01280 [bacterium (Candidatus Stahlbacteria) CG08_land_8_20_14_0_20_40_26]